MIAFFLTFVRFGRSLLRALKDPEFQALFAGVVLILVSGTLVYHAVEGWRYLDSFYFSVTTLTTVGLGDFAPKTDLGKLFTIAYIFLGLGIILGFVNAIAHHAQHSASPVRALLKKFSKKRSK